MASSSSTTPSKRKLAGDDLIPRHLPLPPPFSSTRRAGYSELEGYMKQNEILEKEIKRKASELSLSKLKDRTAKVDDILDTYVQQRQNIEKMHRSSIKSLNDDFKAQKISKQAFSEQLREIKFKQNKLYAGDVTIKRQRSRILMDIEQVISENLEDEEKTGESLANLFFNILCHKKNDRQAEQLNFRKDLISHYGVQPGGHKKQIWCPVAKCFGPINSRTAAHLVPWKLGYETMGDVFNGDGKELMWSMGNGLMMSSEFEDAYDRFDFCLLPVLNQGRPDDWKLVLVNESIRHENINGNQTWDDFDGKLLVWKNDNRPQRRFLYFHYFMCVYKAMRELTPGWEEIRDKTRTGQMWATPGPYLRASMLKKLAQTMGDVELPSELTQGHEISQPPILQPEREALDLKDLLSAFVSSDNFPPIGSDEDD